MGTPQSSSMQERPTPSHLPDFGGDIPAAAAHSCADFGIENKWGNTDLFMPTAAKISMVKRRKAMAAKSSSAGRVCPHLLEKGATS